MPAVEPMYQTKPAWWIAKQLGERLGLGEYFNYKDYAEVLDWQLKQAGSSLAELKTIGVKKTARKTSPYIEPGTVHQFKTATGKIHLYSHEMEAAGFSPLPVFTQHPEPQEGFYRLCLLYTSRCV